MELTAEQGRVLGALVEKERTTPQAYPLTDNALLAACNQTTSREPVVTYDLGTLRLAVRSLREQGLLRTVHRTGERSDKHRHELPAALELSLEQVAVLAVLLLRGPQTAAEVRARTERMHPFGAVEQVERVLAELAARGEPLVVRLERQPGRKEPRWAQLLTGGGLGQPLAGGEVGQPLAGGERDQPLAANPVAAAVQPAGSHAAPERRDRAGDDASPLVVDGRIVAELAQDLAALRAEVAELRDRVDRADPVDRADRLSGDG